MRLKSLVNFFLLIVVNLFNSFGEVVEPPLFDTMIKKGDTVVMHTCKDAEKYKGQILICETDEFTNKSNGRKVVRIEGLLKPIKAKFLQPVNLPNGHKSEDITVSYFGDTMNLSIPIPQNLIVNYRTNDTPLIERLHDLLADFGIEMKATLTIYFPLLKKIIEDCQEHNVQIAPFHGGFAYVGNKINVIVTTY